MDAQSLTTPSAPSKPTGIAGNAQITLSWTAPTNNGGSAITDYIIQMKASWAADSAYVTVADGISPSTSRVITGLINGAGYIFRVRAVNAAGQGAFSIASDPITPRTVPSAPSKPVVIAGNAQVNLSWSAPTNNGGSPITDYIIQRKANGAADSTYVTVADGISPSTSRVITGLINGTGYIFRVRAVNAAGQGAFSIASDPITPRTVPAAPSIISVTSGNGSVSLVWSAPNNGGSPITDYVIQRKVNGTVDNTYVSIADGVSSSTSYTNTGLVNGTAYIYRVAAVNLAGTGGFSAPSAPVLAATIPSAPAAPTGIIGNGQITLNWTAPNSGGAPITDYVIQRKVNGTADNTYVIVADGVSSLTSYTNTGLVNGTAYVYRVAAVNSRGTGPFSSQSAAITPGSLPGAPTGLTAIANSNNTITLNWLRPASSGGAVVTDYAIIGKVSTQPDSSYVTINDSITAANTATFTVPFSGPLIFKVAAVNSVGTGAYSTASNTVNTAPAAPTYVVATATGNGQVTLTWNAPASNGGRPITDYVVQHICTFIPPCDWVTHQDGVSTSTTVVINNLDFYDLYQFRVFAKNAVGTSSPSLTSNTVKPFNLFNKKSWAGAEAIPPKAAIGLPWSNYLNQAADRWSRYIKMSDSIRASIVAINPGWNGIELEKGQYNLYRDPSIASIAGCSVYYFVPVGDKRYNTMSFSLDINTYYQNIFSVNDWVNIFTHELGHALGMGIYWDEYFTGSTPPSNFFLNGTIYSNTQTAYNAICTTGTGSVFTRNKLPVENSGGVGTTSSHWEDNYRFAPPGENNPSPYRGYPGLKNELMIGSISSGATRVLSQLTIKNLVDFGYQEVNPGTSEGTPMLDLVPGPSNMAPTIEENKIKLVCNHSTNMFKFAELDPQTGEYKKIEQPNT